MRSRPRSEPSSDDFTWRESDSRRNARCFKRFSGCLKTNRAAGDACGSVSLLGCKPTVFRGHWPNLTWVSFVSLGSYSGTFSYPWLLLGLVLFLFPSRRTNSFPKLQSLILQDEERKNRLGSSISKSSPRRFCKTDCAILSCVAENNPPGGLENEVYRFNSNLRQ